MDDLKYWIWLSLRCGAGSGLGSYLLRHFPTPQAIFEADEEALRAVEGMSDEILEALTDRDLSHAERILEYCKRTNTGLLTLSDTIYPERLRSIHAAPILLYYRGRIPNIDDNVLLACVGTRRCSDAGRRIAYRLGQDLAYAGAIVVSGMAAGIDTAAHEGALSAGGETVAVLGCGMDTVYPPENKKLMKQIASEGLLLTEYAPGMEPSGKNFPVRNRILSGLCQGTVVIEASDRSGSLITAHHAEKQGRDLFAFPGRSTDETAAGANTLIRSGAKLVTSARDILEEYELLYPHRIFTERIPRHRGFARAEEPPRDAPAPEAPTEERETAREASEFSAPKKPKKAKKTIFPFAKREKKPETDTLSETEKRVLSCVSEMTSVDEIEASLRASDGAPLSTGELLGILTVLEINGFVEALPGGAYRAL